MIFANFLAGANLLCPGGVGSSWFASTKALRPDEAYYWANFHGGPRASRSRSRRQFALEIPVRY